MVGNGFPACRGAGLMIQEEWVSQKKYRKGVWKMSKYDTYFLMKENEVHEYVREKFPD